MRIGILSSQYPAASHTFIRREVEALREAGFPIETFSIRRPHPEEIHGPSAEEEWRQTFYVLPAPPVELLKAHGLALGLKPLRYLETLWLALRHRAPGLRGLLFALFHFGEAIYLARGLASRRVRYLHNHFANSGATVGMLAAFYLEIGWSFTAHGVSELDYPAGVLLADKVRRARFVACASYFMRAQLMRAVDPDHWPKLFVSRCGVEIEKLPEVQNKAARTSKLRVLTVGRLSPEKGHAGLVDAFAAAQAHGLRGNLAIIGDGPERARILERIARHGLHGEVVLPGRAPEAEVLQVMAAADIFVLSSLMEGLPVVLMEAMALGVPVVAPAIAGIPELIEHEKTGLLYRPGDWEELSECLLLLGGDPRLRAELGRRAVDRIEEEFAIEQAAAPLVERLRAELPQYALGRPKPERKKEQEPEEPVEPRRAIEAEAPRRERREPGADEADTQPEE